MNMRKPLTSVLLLLSNTTVLLTQAQYAPVAYSKWQLGAGLLATVYQGDLTPKRLGSIATSKPGFTLFTNYKLIPQLTVQAALAISSLAGNDAVYTSPAYRRERNFKYGTPIRELSIKALYQLHKYYAADDDLLFPYVGVGIAITTLNVTKDYSSITTKLSTEQPSILSGIAADDAHGTPSILVSLPVVVGVRKQVHTQWDVFAELNYRLTTTDYLDGFSQAANPSKKDKYYTVAIGMIYKIKRDKGIQCPSY